MAKQVRIGLIGCGGIANGFHLKDLSQVEGAELVYYADMVEAAARSTAERWKNHWKNYKITTRPEELLASPDVDAVVVATHHATHAEFGIKAIEAGKHVLVQKPLTTRIADADRFVEVAAAHPEIRVQCLPFNWSAPLVAARRLIDDDAIGKICSARMRIAHQGPARDSWFYKPEIAEFGASMDMGVYAVSGITSLLGSAVSCSGLVSTFEEGVRIDDNAVWLLKFESGALGTAETAWTQVTGVESTVIYGLEGIITLGGPGNEPLRVYRRTEGISWASRGEWSAPRLQKDPTALPHRHFVECVREGRQPLGTPSHARHVVEIMLAAHESNRTGQRVELRTRV
jgi:D-xylose 1-dehydrogenase (NADP+, D-xylono-1,5-lactone-forming)